MAAAALAPMSSTADIVVGVSWVNFQEERWKTDEAAIKSALEAAGAEYINGADALGSLPMASDVESLIARGANALIILAQDASAITPAVVKAAQEGIPVVGYDRLIENADAFYITFDNVEVGRMQARAVYAAQPKGNYVFIKGSRRIRTRTSSTAASLRCFRRPSTKATSRSSAISTRMAGCPRTPSGTWSRS